MRHTKHCPEGPEGLNSPNYTELALKLILLLQCLDTKKYNTVQISIPLLVVE